MILALRKAVGGSLRAAVPTVEIVLLVVASLFIVSILASKASVRLGVPSLLLFVGIGMLAGSGGPGGIYFDHPWVTQLNSRWLPGARSRLFIAPEGSTILRAGVAP